MYPELKLPEPISVEDTERLNELYDYERQFTLLLLEKGLVVYPRPQIEGTKCIPDFFIVNPDTGSGKIVEVSLLSYDKEEEIYSLSYKKKKKEKRKGINDRRRSTRRRKERQREEILSLGIPCAFLYRENLEMIRENIWPNLF